ncbi:MAG: DUF2339 domain-containing protein, partial [Alphaproteobacteria bacterium]|nr:DUF2339 domain-containing protein [Alphaproteobacteria bacterium]
NIGPLSYLLFGSFLSLIGVVASDLIRNLFLVSLAEPAGFIERGVITVGLLVCALSIFSFGRAFGQDFLFRWSRILLHLTMLRILWFDLLIHNPMFDASQLVGSLPVGNGVTMTYGAGLLASIFVANGAARERFAIRSLYKTLGFILLFALVTLQVRQAFHGSLLADQNMSHAEFYTYSFAWLLIGLGLLTAGIVLPSRTARMASLAFLLLTTGKVFLLDADELEGLYRVFSFLGLGISLIGLSFFYTRFILKAAQPR